MSEPLVTWNLYVTPIVTAVSTGIILLVVSSLFQKRDKKDEKIAELLKEREEFRRAEMLEWRNRFSTTQCAIKERLEEVAVSLNEKVPWEHCAERRREEDAEMRAIEQRLRAGGI
jgi:hypothetical protein